MKIEFKHACPECGTDLEPVLTENGNLETFWCPDCDTNWAVCPDCGNLADMDENWNFEQGVCDCCQTSGDNGGLGITILSFDDPEEMFEAFKAIFGDEGQLDGRGEWE